MSRLQLHTNLPLIAFREHQQNSVSVSSLQIERTEAFEQRVLENLDDPSVTSTVKAAVLKRRVEFLAGRLCAQNSLKKLGLSPVLAIAPSENRAPVWPLGFVGSITHSDSLAISIVGKKGPVERIGIDLEEVFTSDKLNLKSHICIDNEFEKLQLETSFTDEQLLTLMFSAKETLYKNLFPEVKRFFGFKSARIIRVDEHSTEFSIELQEDLTTAFCANFVATGNFSFFEGSCLTYIIS